LNPHVCAILQRVTRIFVANVDQSPAKQYNNWGLVMRISPIIARIPNVELMNIKNNQLVPVILFCVILLVYFISPIVTSFDSRWSIHTAMSIIKEGNTNLNEYEEDLQKHSFYAITTINGNHYSIFPVGVSIIAVPFVYVLDTVLDPIEHYGKVEKFVASVLTALTAVFIYFIAHFFVTRSCSLVIVFVFSFCTSAWSTASRALWQHAPSMLMLTIALYLLLLAKEKPKLVQYVSIPLAFSFVVRPTNSIPILLLTFFVLFQYRRFFLKYISWALPITLLLLTFNILVYQAPLPPYSNPQRIFSNPHFCEALMGNLVSPSRGLFFFTPILLLSIHTMFHRVRKLQFRNLDPYLVMTILMHWVVISSFPHWWGGHSFGPRFFSDMIPFFMYFLILYFKDFAQYRGVRRVIMGLTIIVTIGISFFIHFQGSHTWAVYQWNSEPVNIDRKPSRLWDWSDIQFLRGF
jgi:hypothetical protein